MWLWLTPLPHQGNPSSFLSIIFIFDFICLSCLVRIISCSLSYLFSVGFVSSSFSPLFSPLLVSCLFSMTPNPPAHQNKKITLPPPPQPSLPPLHSPLPPSSHSSFPSFSQNKNMAQSAYLECLRSTLSAAICLQNFPSQIIERHNKPEAECKTSSELLLNPVVVSRNEHQQVKIESSINSVRISGLYFFFCCCCCFVVVVCCCFCC